MHQSAIISSPGNTRLKRFIEKRYSLLVLLSYLLIWISRTPYFLSPNLIPDGDESILGIMALDTLDLNTFPLFCYGQTYGFSLFETYLTALNFGVFGVSHLTMKCSMLFLWSIGWLFFVLAIKEIAGKNISLLGGLLMILSPGWHLTSMKAWGGYVTAFSLSQIILYIVFKCYKAGVSKQRESIFLGLLSVIVLYAQPVWILALFPLFIRFAFRIENKREFFSYFLISAGISFILIWAGKSLNHDHWFPPLFRNIDVYKSALLLPHRCASAIHGAYFLNQPLPFSKASLILGYSAVVLLGWAAIQRVVSFYRDRAICLIDCLLLGIMALMFFSLCINHQLFGYRYFLPIPSLFVTVVCLLCPKMHQGHPFRKMAFIFLVTFHFLLAPLTIPALSEITHDGSQARNCPDEKTILSSLMNDLEGENIHYVFSTDPMFQWNIMFESRKQVTARWYFQNDRIPIFPKRVEEAYNHGQSSAVVGFYPQIRRLASWLVGHPSYRRNLIVIDERYFIFYNPPCDLLKYMGFHLDC